MQPYGSLRTHGAGTLRPADADETVVLGGWVASRRDHGGVVFLDLRDASGLCQVVVDPATEGIADDAPATAHRLRDEWVVRITGTVRTRPSGMENPALATGRVEVAATTVEILARAETPPFPVDDRAEVDEALRLRHRYVDLRRPVVAHAIRTRAHVTRVMRRVLERHGFLEVETPMLTRSTPEGARDFLVPSRMQPGSSYALPQSPQLFKQLLMVGGMERYYQIVRCFRDEDLRADRQPEFTQLDVEASFVDEEDVLALCEELFAELWAEVADVELTTPFPRIAHAEALRRFGSDRPDLRFGLELVDLDEVFTGTEVGVFAGALAAGGSVVGLPVPGGAALTRKQLDGWVDFARARGAKGLAWAAVNEDRSLRSPLAKFMSERETDDLLATCTVGHGDLVLLAAGPQREARELLGAVRVALAREQGLVEEGTWSFAWVTDFPLYQWDAAAGRWDAEHHPFTAPRHQDLDLLDTDPGAVTARAYDLVLNGVELGGGSLRIHDRDLQLRVLELLGVGAEEAREKFGFLLRALASGAPPHGGIAFGLDRIVMLLVGAASLREVIPFPKTQSGADPLTEAPAPVAPQQLAEVGLRLLPLRKKTPAARNTDV